MQGKARQLFHGGYAALHQMDEPQRWDVSRVVVYGDCIDVCRHLFQLAAADIRGVAAYIYCDSDLE